ncbi:something about silencing protein 10-like [Pecten maximus]|uniref:something about silencing protein 10-like n=1 Tax=Pecten maximus TaxID=6579 RepID=UPI00145889A9|nr:something about silencing protein 10-like [Pecten maximus]
MPKKGKKRTQVAAPVYGSDDERRYENEPEPDQEDEDYFYDDVDNFHMQKEKMLLDQGVQSDDDMNSESEDEVLGIGGVSDDDLLSDDDLKVYKKQLRRIKLNRKKSDMGSDLEDQDDEGEPDHTTYGKKVTDYYNADFSDDDVDLSGSEGEEGAAALEEKEALALQKRINAELDDQDFGLDLFKKKKVEESEDEEEEKITKDLTKLSKKEKLQLLKKESPEMLTLIEDYKSKMTEVRDVLMPLLKLVREGKIQGKAGDYVETKTKLHLNYCTNISFYMMLKSKQIAVHNHPVIKRLVQYRNLMKEMEPLDNQLKEEITDIMDRLKKGEEVEFSVEEKKQGFVRRKSVKSSRHRVESKKLSQLVSESDDDDDEDDVEPKMKKSGGDQYETEEEKAALEYYRMMKGARSGDNEEMDSGAEEAPEVDNGMEEGEEDEEGKRAITYQIAKNKGLTPKRKKEQRNPRVKNKLKFRKAKIRRRGQVREARTEMSRYGGEVSGIRAGVKRSIKMKV